MKRAMLSRIRPLAMLFGVVMLTAGAGAVRFYAAGLGAAPTYRFATVQRGSLTAAVSATGTLNAVITVQVGSQISGQIRQLLVDFNDHVRSGQVIARIDPDIFEAKVSQAKAQLDAARMAVVSQRAAVEKTRADLGNAAAALAVAHAQGVKARVLVVDAQRDLTRKRDLRRKELIAQADEDAAQVGHDSAGAQYEAARAQERAQASLVRSAEAQLEVAKAQLDTARAQVGQNEAALRQAQLDLEHTIIRAPVDGVVVSRNVDVGQTVAASLQAPTLFTIAQDLARMQVDTNVDEADVGRVRVGQRVTFTVDSFPGQTFAGEVVQVRKAPQVLQNVVTYDVVVSAPNPALTLLPGMTASVRIVTVRKDSVLLAPNAALRFRPPRVEHGRPLGAQAAGLTARVWTLGPDGSPTPVPLQLGVSDGTSTEVVGGTLSEGQPVVVGLAAAAARPAQAGGGPRLRF